MKKLLLSVCLATFLFSCVDTTHASELSELTQEQIYEKRMELYKATESISGVPWYFLAAVDQYERNVRYARPDVPNPEGIIGVYYTKEEWVGMTNPNVNDESPTSISYFQGKGVDGDGDGKASLSSNTDVLSALASFLSAYGFREDDFRIGVWDYYQRDRSVGIVLSLAKMYSTYQTLDLDATAFPLPKRFNYSYRNTWGDARGWGGKRIHEGTDIFADYSVPVRATTYGVIEMKGWNRYGGWRIGIRDIHNNYHYYAHLNGFAEGLTVGQAVKPGQVIGGVGSTGYGPPGTSGKFPPHLHYGMYKDNGFSEWSFDPTPHLRLWERQGDPKN